jgi:tRNA-binding protein
MAVDYKDFEKVEIRIGRILEAKVFQEARKPVCQLLFDFGESEVKQSSAQIRTNYSIKDLIGRDVVNVTNFPAKKIAGFKSEVLVLCKRQPWRCCSSKTR